MFEYKRLIKKSLKSHTLFIDAFGFGLVKIGSSDKYLAGKIAIYKIYKWLFRRFHKYVGKSKKAEIMQREKGYVWICWLQGIENAPKVVQDCYNSLLYWVKNRKIIVITSENYDQYVHFPDFIIDKWKKGYITNTHFSDILRLELLIQYGGLWVDATTFFTGPLPSYITKEDLFVYRDGWMDMEIINMASWIIYSKYTNNIVLKETRDLLYKYWEKNKFLKNYFLLHIFFRIVTDEYQEEWTKVPYFNQIDCHMLMNELENEYKEARIEQITKLTNIHKLTYKFEQKNENSTSNYLETIYKV